MNNKNILRAVAVVVALLVTLVMNFGSQSIAIVGAGNTVADIANEAAIFFLPANYVFGIWGVIYTLLIGFAVFQARPAGRADDRLNLIRWAFIASCVANSVWLVLFLQRQFWASTIAMLALLAALLVIYLRLGVGKTPIRGAGRWWLHLPFSVYLGWISVATVANFTYALYNAGWDGFGIAGETWALIMMAVAGLLAALMLFTRRDIAYALVVIWALLGIASRFSPTSGTVTGGALVISAVIAGVVALTLFSARSAGMTPKAA